ncbi:MAG TPA: mobile mystery protein A [Beijerinckiaceae bacterium]|jgi:predicted DNA-binding mobile mystery protein A
MSTVAAQLRALRALDTRLTPARELAATLTKPPKGWVRAIREALGMSQAQLAQRLGVQPPSVSDLERSEALGSIQLKTLQRAAEALDCQLVYALVPRKPLEAVLRDRARREAERRFALVEHTMRLEDQAVHDQETREEQLHELERAIDPRSLWAI